MLIHCTVFAYILEKKHGICYGLGKRVDCGVLTNASICLKEVFDVVLAQQNLNTYLGCMFKKDHSYSTW